MRRLRLQDCVGSNRLGGLLDRFVVGRNKASLDRRAGPGAAFEQAALDQKNIDAFLVLLGRWHAALESRKYQEAEESRAAAMATQTSNAVKSCQMSSGSSRGSANG